MFRPNRRVRRKRPATTGANEPADLLYDTRGPELHDGCKMVDAESRRVFSIVMSEYQKSKQLPNAFYDALAVEDTFKKLGYTVETCANVSEDELDRMFTNFRRSLSTQTYRIVLHIAGHGYEHKGHLILELGDGTKVHVDEFVVRLNLELDEIISKRADKNKEDPVHSVAILVLWDACREKLFFPSRPQKAYPKSLRERQQAMIHSCPTGGQSYDGCAGSKNSPFILALMDLLGINTPFNVLELAMHLNVKVKTATLGKQSVEVSCEATKMDRIYDWFVDIKKCNQLRMRDITWKQLQADIDDPKACARLISLWDCQQQLLSDLAAENLDRVKAQTEDFERQTAEAKRSLQEASKRAEDAERRAQNAEDTAANFERQAAEAKRSLQGALKRAEDAERQAAEAKRSLQGALKRAEDAERQAAEAKRSLQGALKRAEDAERQAAEAKRSLQGALNECNTGKLLTICGTAIITAFLVFIFLCPACKTKYVEVPVEVRVKTPPEPNPSAGAIILAIFSAGVMVR